MNPNPNKETPEQEHLERQMTERLEQYGCPDSYIQNELEWWKRLLATHYKAREAEIEHKAKTSLLLDLELKARHEPGLTSFETDRIVDFVDFYKAQLSKESKP